ncbi:MAG: hypothetical protein JO180_08850 [Gemmatirosa sp.]|nr:hypothetical protein [Gemmatirosa sp.]
MAAPHPPIASAVERVASNYRAWGYEIVFEPSAADLPRFLGDYRPDLLARKADEAVLIEVKDTASAETYARYQEIASRLREHRGWRLDLVVANPRDRLPGAGSHPVLSESDIHSRYREAEGLMASGHVSAAFLLAWAATEAALRLLAETSAIAVQRANTPTLLKQLVTEGVISREQYDALWSIYQRRNVVAHGFALRDEPDGPLALIALGNALLRERPQAA